MFDIKTEYMEEGYFSNIIEIKSKSKKVSDNIKIENDEIILSNAKFPLYYVTNGLNHTSSVIGQLIMAMEIFLEDL